MNNIQIPGAYNNQMLLPRYLAPPQNNNFPNKKLNKSPNQIPGNRRQESCCDKFLRAFSHLPCSSWDVNVKGWIGLTLVVISIIIVVVVLGLIPVYLNAAKADNPSLQSGLASENTTTTPAPLLRQQFAIDVTDGFQLQSKLLFDALNQTNTTIAQNNTVTNQINSLTNQLNEKTKLKIGDQVDKISNVTLEPRSANLVGVSFRIETNPILDSESVSLKDSIDDLFKNISVFQDLSVENATIVLKSSNSMSDAQDNTTETTTEMNKEEEEPRQNYQYNPYYAPPYQPAYVNHYYTQPVPDDSDLISPDVIKDSSNINRLPDSIVAPTNITININN